MTRPTQRLDPSELDESPVKVYFNSRSRVFSILGRPHDRVIGYAKRVAIQNASFKVSYAGRDRARRTGHKNVHAYVCGHVAATVPDPAGSPVVVSYNPYTCDRFTRCDSPGSDSVTRADLVVLDVVNDRPYVMAYGVA